MTFEYMYIIIVFLYFVVSSLQEVEVTQQRVTCDSLEKDLRDERRRSSDLVRTFLIKNIQPDLEVVVLFGLHIMHTQIKLKYRIWFNTKRYINHSSWYLFCIQQLPDSLSTGAKCC